MSETSSATPDSESPPDAEVTPKLKPRIYIASLSDYAAGRLHGVWLDAAQPIVTLNESIAAMLAASPVGNAREWVIHDYEDFAGLRLSEGEDLEYTSYVAELLKRWGPPLAAWAEMVDDPNAFEEFEACYLGHHEDLATYGRQLLEDLGYVSELERVVPAYLLPYIDIDSESFARDLCLSGDIGYCMAPEGGVWVFDRRSA